jgi:hypothetical protein
MADIFREVDEDVRTDRLAQFWSKYSFVVYGAAVAIVIGTALYVFLSHEKIEAANAAGARFEAAQELAQANKSVEAAAAFAALAQESHAPQGVRAAAALRAAEEKSLGDREGAVKDLDALALDANAPPLLQDAARLRAGLLRADEGDKAELERRFGPLLNGPYRFTARETLALAALKRGDTEDAGRLFDKIIVDPGTPANIRQRAEALASLARGGGKFTPPAAPPTASPNAPWPPAAAPGKK